MGSELSDSLRAVRQAACRLLSREFPYVTVALDDSDRVAFSKGYRDCSTACGVATRKTDSMIRGFVAFRSAGGIAVLSGGGHVLSATRGGSQG